MRWIRVIGLVLWCLGATAQPVRMVVSKPQVLVGEAFVVSVGVAGRDVVFAAPLLPGGDSVSGVELLGFHDADSMDEAGRPVSWRAYRLVCLSPGAWTFPPQSASVRSPAGRVPVRSPVVRGYAELVPAATPDLRPEPLLPAPRRPAGWQPYALVLGGLLVVVGLLWLKRRRRPAKRTRNPYRLARRQLRVLARQASMPDDKAVLAQLDGVLHRYLAQQFGLPAHRLDPAETARRLAGSGIGREAVQATEAFLSRLQTARFAPPGTETPPDAAGLVAEGQACLQGLAESTYRRPPPEAAGPAIQETDEKRP